ncbi:MAG: cytochrome c oxidase subunit II [Solirubrobacteraceae bacterium]|nr:cytochrome c oxidase subunit II [Patulibacter sp.]
MPRKSLVARLRKGFIPLAAAASAPLFFAQNASANWISTEHGGSPNADAIHSLYLILMITGLVVFFLVEGLLVYTLWKFRAGRGHEAQQIHGNTKLEIGWTGGAAVLVIILAVVSFFKLGEIRDPPNSDASGYKTTTIAKDPGTNQKIPPDGKAMHIIITAFQYGWRFTYDDGDPSTPNVYAYRDLYAPTNTTVLLDITSQDVIHSWWVPQLGGKFDAVQGFHNWTWFKIPASKAGSVFRGQCAELCGRNHANMTLSVHALSPADFTKWLADKQAQLEQAKVEGAKQRAVVDAGETLK